MDEFGRGVQRRAQPKSLDALPAEILEFIIAHLPIKDAVRTSILSRAWLHRWQFAPWLSLDWARQSPPVAIDGVLASFSGLIPKFSCHLQDELSNQQLGNWFRVLSNKGLKCLFLCFLNRKSTVTVESLCSFSDLTMLGLEGCCISWAGSSIESFVLPRLLRLRLCEVNFPRHGEKLMEAIISGSPDLMSLQIINIWITPLDSDAEIDSGGDYSYDNWIISAPNLKTLVLVSACDLGWNLDELHSISFAHLDLRTCPNSGIIFSRLLCGLAHTVTLEAYIPCQLSNPLEDLGFYFKRLNKVSLSLLIWKFSLATVYSLLEHAPCLQRLDMKIETEDISEHNFQDITHGVKLDVSTSNPAVDCLPCSRMTIYIPGLKRTDIQPHLRGLLHSDKGIISIRISVLEGITFATYNSRENAVESTVELASQGINAYILCSNCFTQKVSKAEGTVDSVRQDHVTCKMFRSMSTPKLLNCVEFSESLAWSHS